MNRDPIIRDKVDVVRIEHFAVNMAMGADGKVAVILILNGGQYAGALPEEFARQLGAELAGAGFVARLKEPELQGLLEMHSPIVQVKPSPLIIAK